MVRELIEKWDDAKVRAKIANVAPAHFKEVKHLEQSLKEALSTMDNLEERALSLKDEVVVTTT